MSSALSFFLPPRTGRGLALARRRRRQPTALMPPRPSLGVARPAYLPPSTGAAASRASPSFSLAADALDDADADADAALARRRALFLLDESKNKTNNTSKTPPPLRIWRMGIDEPRLLKALEGAGFAGRVLVCPSASGGCDAVLAVPRKAAGGRQRVDLGVARSAARNARAEFVLLRATTARAVFEALAPLVARREVLGLGEDDEDDDEDDQQQSAERVAAAVERLRRSAPALRPAADQGDERRDEDEDVGFTRVPTLRAVVAAASGARSSAPATTTKTTTATPTTAASALRLLELLAWSEDVAARLPPAASEEEASRRPLLTPPRAARLPEPAWLWLGTAGAAADGGDGEGSGGNSSGDDNSGGRAAMVPRNRDARADAAFRVTRDDGGPLQPGGPGDAKRRKQAAEERRRRSKGGGGGGGAW